MVYQVNCIYHFLWYCIIYFQFSVKCEENLLLNDYLKMSSNNIIKSLVRNKLPATVDVLIDLVDTNKDKLLSNEELRFWFFHLATKSTER
jgi:hypothetical protein